MMRRIYWIGLILSVAGSITLFAWAVRAGEGAFFPLLMGAIGCGELTVVFSHLTRHQ